MKRLNDIITKLAEQSVLTETGTIGSTSVAANNYTDVSVSFSKSFSRVPKVIVSLVSESTAGAIGSLEVSAISVTKTGCKIRIFNAGSSNRAPGATWVAIGS